jgi:acetoin utilization deacetylase AcuC-like enzyme
MKESRKTQAQKMKIFYNDLYEVALPPGHRFPMQKYRMVRELLQQDMDISDLVEFSPSPVASAGDLRTTHDPEYIKRFLCNQLTERENRNIGFPWSRAGVKRALSSVGGTVAAMHAVCRDGYAAAGHLAGGTHHAFFDRGEGFCVFSDIAVAINVALRDYGEEAGGCLSRVLIVDLDVHQVLPCDAARRLREVSARQEQGVEALPVSAHPHPQRQAAQRSAKHNSA